MSNQLRSTAGSTGTTPRVGGTKHIDRRTLVKGAAWSVPVIAAAAATPLASASVTLNFDLVYVSGPTANTTQVARGQTPWADLIFQSAGPDPAPSVQITVSVPSVNNDPTATLALPNNGASAGWTLVNTFQQGGRDYYTFLMAPVPVGQYDFRWAHVVAGPVNTSYAFEMNLEVTGGESNTSNNGGVHQSGQIFVVA
ncbi:conserved exported hypothetical protein [Microbacterium sp. 8M]|uniref:hypothetical protein n=1 Tax=Microbacterium sp. 8M TaxID=2653153 RepID=UPI0012F02E4D|nr:hypothetical protein [Microbacterium sp. 8M]VXC30009.1 conserved exported hypothetical protein [Microbacterium sp. 8M]